jgi:hypothetical protein
MSDHPGSYVPVLLAKDRVVPNHPGHKELGYREGKPPRGDWELITQEWSLDMLGK